VRIAILVTLASVYAAVVVAQAQAPSAPVFTQQQAETGRAAYLKNCASCHQPDLSGSNEIPQLAGESFIGTWGSKTTKDLRDYMSAAMPYGQPSLDAESYTVIVAFVLSSNGAVAGEEKLTPLTAVPIGDVTAKRTPTKEGSVKD
jgi:ubiquinol-cytochrome c reductase cytochrome c subunit